MKRMRRLLCLLLLGCLFSVIAFAEPLFALEGLEILSTAQDEAGNLYLSGRMGGPGRYGRRLLCLTPAEELLWQIGSDVSLDDWYWSVVPMGGGQVAALNAGIVQEGTYLPMLDYIQNGQVVEQIPLPQVQCLGLYGVPEGFLLETAAAGQTTLMLLNHGGEILWQYAFDQPFSLTDVVAAEEGYYCAGYGYEGYPEQAVASLYCLSRDGQTLRTVDRFTGARLTALISDGQGLCVIGDTEPVLDWRSSFLIRYLPEGIRQETSYSYGEAAEGSMFSLLKQDDGYLTACYQRKQYGQLTLLRFGEKGQLIQRWQQPAGSIWAISGCQLYAAGEDVLAVVWGLDEQRIGYSTEVLRLEMPQKPSAP